jgi:Flp pilus assembly pilin Flp
MSPFRKQLQQLCSDERGPTAVEHAITLALIAVVFLATISIAAWK